jgi:phage terminase large subunit-like protein
MVYVLEDASAQGLSPAAWANRAIALYRRHQANAIVAEVNRAATWCARCWRRWTARRR